MKIFWPDKIFNYGNLSYIINVDLYRITNTKDMDTLKQRWRRLGDLLCRPSEDVFKMGRRRTPEGRMKRDDIYHGDEPLREMMV